MKNYSDLITYIKYLATFPKYGDGYVLKPFKKLLKKIGNPEKKLWGIHIVGTNGKGSTAAMCKSILTQTGLKIGFYISPHIQSYRERIQINQKWISEADFVRLVELLKKTIEKNFVENERKPTWFEILTAAAFIYFVEQKCDLVILEAGLGGRLDASNVVNFPVVVVTSISKEHTEVLGKTLTKITKDKAAVIKKNSKVVFGDKMPLISKKIIKEQCRKVKADFYETQSSLKKINWQGTLFTLRAKGIFNKHFRTSLIGSGQAENGSLAVLACLLLAEAKGFSLTLKQIQKGLEQVKWPGRFEVINPKLKNILLPGTKIVLDGAHNLGGVVQLTETLKIFKKRGNKIVFIFQCMRDKKHKEMIKKLQEIADGIVFTSVLDILARALSGKELKNLYPFGVLGKDYNDSFAKAQKIGGKNSLIVIGGSLYLVGQYRQYLLGEEEKTSSPDHLLMNTDAVRTH